MDEIVAEFLTESKANFGRIDGELAALAKNPRDVETLKNIYRTLHTLKGSAAFLDFKGLEDLSQTSGHLVKQMQEGKAALNPEIARGLVEMVAKVRVMLGNIERTEKEGAEDVSALVALFKQHTK